MDVFSQVENDGDDIFLTQTPRNLVPLVPNFEAQSDYVGIQGGTTQNEVLCRMQYSDISDAENFDIPCSQVHNNESGQGWVF